MSELFDSYPEMTAIAVLVLGFVLGKLAQVASGYLLGRVDQLAARYGTRREVLFSPLFQRVFGLIVYATVLVIAILVAARLLDIEQFSSGLDTALSYVPRLVAGLFIIGIGNVVGTLLRDLTAGLISQGDTSAAGPRLVHASVVTIAVITALEQFGLDISFVTGLALIMLAALLGGLSLAFALGARQYVANLMAQGELARYATGDQLRIDSDEGSVAEIHRTGLILSTEEGLVAVPASRLAEQRVIKLNDRTTVAE